MQRFLRAGRGWTIRLHFAGTLQVAPDGRGAAERVQVIPVGPPEPRPDAATAPASAGREGEEWQSTFLLTT